MKKLSLAIALISTSTFAAIPVDLSQKSYGSILSTIKLEETKKYIDFNGTEHIRMQQTYAGYPVDGADIVVHIPKGMNLSDSQVAMNGMLYENLEKDLQSADQKAFSNNQAELALAHAVALYQQAGGSSNYLDPHTERMVFMDENNKAHWAYKVSFYIDKNGVPERPTYILDAASFELFQSFNGIKTIDLVSGGGFGGNPKIGKVAYDGLENNYASLTLFRDDSAQVCYLRNNEVFVKNIQEKDAISHFKCAATDPKHNNIFWNAELNQVNEGYSPDNDALHSGRVITEMYQKWYGVPVLVKDGKPYPLYMRVHLAKEENAFWDDRKMQMTFGDGGSAFYPFTSLDIAAHEISHGFTSQHAKLNGDRDHSAGLNEAFSDMASKAGEYYAKGKNTWRLGAEIIKDPKKVHCKNLQDCAIRYMDNPPLDGESIDHVSKFKKKMDEHLSCGVFNKAFYLMSTAEGWNTKKAFDVMVKANMHYWTARTTFQEAGCGVIKAAKDYQYDLAAVEKALNTVGINPKQCS